MPGEPVTHIRFGSGKITAFNPPRPEAIREKKVAAARRTAPRSATARKAKAEAGQNHSE
ncbi:MAG: hypothetical protein IKF99_18305 [Oscillospiraceae bacterium]|nr:hypothetical protein [Oscillospiraceae bacterium]